MMIRTIDELINQAKSKPTEKIAVVAAEDHEVILAIKEAVALDLVEPFLIGDGAEIRRLCQQENFAVKPEWIVEAAGPVEAAAKAVELVRSGEAKILMKGLVATSVYLKAILNKEKGLRSGSVLSHLALFEVPGYDRLIGVTDAAMNVNPDLKTKQAIIQNSIGVMHGIGVEVPKVGVLAAVEVVNPDMPATLDAAALAMMSQRKQFKGAVVDGPLALDNAVNPEALKIKGISSPVEAQADLLVCPEIVAANVLYKGLIHFAKARAAAIIVGARAPVVLTSRADSHADKLASIALAAVLS